MHAHSKFKIGFNHFNYPNLLHKGTEVGDNIAGLQCSLS